jgi:hypothetical protein
MNEERISEITEKLVADYYVADGGPLSSYVESALREVWNEAVQECAKVCLDRANKCGGRAAPKSVGDVCNTVIRSLALP